MKREGVHKGLLRPYESTQSPPSSTSKDLNSREGGGKGERGKKPYKKGTRGRFNLKKNTGKPKK